MKTVDQERTCLPKLPNKVTLNIERYIKGQRQTRRSALLVGLLKREKGHGSSLPTSYTVQEKTCKNDYVDILVQIYKLVDLCRMTDHYSGSTETVQI